MQLSHDSRSSRIRTECVAHWLFLLFTLTEGLHTCANFRCRACSNVRLSYNEHKRPIIKNSRYNHKTRSVSTTTTSDSGDKTPSIPLPLTMTGWLPVYCKWERPCADCCDAFTQDILNNTFHRQFSFWPVQSESNARELQVKFSATPFCLAASFSETVKERIPTSERSGRSVDLTFKWSNFCWRVLVSLKEAFVTLSCHLSLSLISKAFASTYSFRRIYCREKVAKLLFGSSDVIRASIFADPPVRTSILLHGDAKSLNPNYTYLHLIVD